MFGDYSTAELLSIFAMQGFGLKSFFRFLCLWPWAFAIIFGQMGVINMATGIYDSRCLYYLFSFESVFQLLAEFVFRLLFVAMIVAFLPPVRWAI